MRKLQKARKTTRGAQTQGSGPSSAADKKNARVPDAKTQKARRKTAHVCMNGAGEFEKEKKKKKERKKIHRWCPQ